MGETYGGDEINAVLTLVERMTADGDVQLSIMAHALVIACKSTKADRATAMREIGRLWDRDDPLVPLRQSPAALTPEPSHDHPKGEL